MEVIEKNYLKSRLKYLLQKHEGRGKAITAGELSKLLKYNERSVRLIIRELITDGMPIASSTEAPAGYFVISNWVEARDYAESIKGRLVEDAIRRRDFNRSAALYLKPAEQPRLL